MLTRTDLNLLALRATFDLPFYVLVFGAATLSCAGRGRAGRCSRCSGCGAAAAGGVGAGGVDWLWLVPATPRKTLAWLALLVAVPPLLWMLADVIVVGEPVHSLTKTREVAGEFGRSGASARPSA